MKLRAGAGIPGSLSHCPLFRSIALCIRRCGADSLRGLTMLVRDAGPQGLAGRPGRAVAEEHICGSPGCRVGYTGESQGRTKGRPAICRPSEKGNSVRALPHCRTTRVLSSFSRNETSGCGRIAPYDARGRKRPAAGYCGFRQWRISAHRLYID